MTEVFGATVLAIVATLDDRVADPAYSNRPTPLAGKNQQNPKEKLRLS
jgi:hypothetical protein